MGGLYICVVGTCNRRRVIHVCFVFFSTIMVGVGIVTLGGEF